MQMLFQSLLFLAFLAFSVREGTAEISPPLTKRKAPRSKLAALLQLGQESDHLDHGEDADERDAMANQPKTIAQVVRVEQTKGATEKRKTVDLQANVEQDVAQGVKVDPKTKQPTLTVEAPATMVDLVINGKPVSDIGRVHFTKTLFLNGKQISVEHDKATTGANGMLQLGGKHADVQQQAEERAIGALAEHSQQIDQAAQLAVAGSNPQGVAVMHNGKPIKVGKVSVVKVVYLNGKKISQEGEVPDHAGSIVQTGSEAEGQKPQIELDLDMNVDVDDVDKLAPPRHPPKWPKGYENGGNAAAAPQASK